MLSRPSSICGFVFLCMSLIALLVCVNPGPASAYTTYELIATLNTVNQTNPAKSGFTIIYEDKDNSGFFNPANDTVLYFSGVDYQVRDQSDTTIPPEQRPLVTAHYTTIAFSPQHGEGPNIQAPYGVTYTDGDGGEYWRFESPVPPPGVSRVSTRITTIYSNWKPYTQTVVPLPPSAILLGSGLLGLALARRRKWFR